MIKFMDPLKSSETSVFPVRVMEIKAWTRSVLCLEKSVLISVNELACSQPDCPPKQVVVLILSNEEPARTFSIHKALLDTSEKDVVDALSTEEWAKAS